MILDRITIADRRAAKSLVEKCPSIPILALADDDPSIWGAVGPVCWYPLVDGERIDANAFWTAVERLAWMMLEEDQVLVCCHAGESRSVAVVAGLLLRDHVQILDDVDLVAALEEVPPLFLEHHRWFTEEDEQQRLRTPSTLLQHPEAPRLFAAYALLGKRWERSFLNAGLWTTILSTDSVKLNKRS